MSRSSPVWQANVHLICILALALTTTGVEAQQRIALRTSRRGNVSRLAPGLFAASELSRALDADLLVLGTDRHGRLILELPGNVRFNQARRLLGRVRGVTGVVPHRPQAPITKINQLIVHHARGALQGLVAALGRVKNTTYLPKKSSQTGSFVVVRATGGITTASLKQIEALAGVTRVELNHRYTLMAGRRSRDRRGVVCFADELEYKWGLERIHISDAWSVQKTSDIVVAVLDTGVDKTHADLKHEFTGRNFVDDNDVTDDKIGHGTKCAGVLGAIADNGIGVAGVVSGARVLPVKIFSDDGFSAEAGDIARAIDWAVSQGAKVLNNSWGGPDWNDAIHDAIDNAEMNGVLFVCAAGNDSSDIDTGNVDDLVYPAGYNNANIISVLATTEFDNLAWFSNYGTLSVDIGAPGVPIYSTTAGGGYAYDDGTSFAAPFVSGACALVWAANPTKSWSEIRDLILDNARGVPQLEYKCETGGILCLSFLANKPCSGTTPSTGGGVAAKSTGAAAGARDVAAPAKATGKVETFRGTLRYPVYALGGETTGTVLKTDKGSFELDLKGIRESAAMCKKLAGKQVAVEGVLEDKSGVERKQRRIIRVRRLEPVKQNK